MNAEILSTLDDETQIRILASTLHGGKLTDAQKQNLLDVSKQTLQKFTIQSNVNSSVLPPWGVVLAALAVLFGVCHNRVWLCVCASLPAYAADGALAPLVETTPVSDPRSSHCNFSATRAGFLCFLVVLGVTRRLYG